ncbi:hypothetical protein SUDANB121_05525 [Nocardiopsis dassonvillei]
MRYRRAMIILASTSSNTAPVIASLVAADERTVREAIHAFNTQGLSCLDPMWAGGRPRLLTPDEEALVLRLNLFQPESAGHSRVPATGNHP